MGKISLDQVNQVTQSAIGAFNKQQKTDKKNRVILDFTQKLEEDFDDGQFLPSIPISWLRSRNIRTFSTDSEEFAQLKHSIHKDGIVNLPTVTTHKGYIYIVDGHRRISALRELGTERVDCILKKGKTSEIQTMQAMANLATEKMDLIEQANTALQFDEEFGMDQKEIGTRLKIADRKKISKLLMLARWPEEYKKVVQENPDKLKQTTLFKYIRSDMDSGEIEEVLNNILNPSRKGATAKRAEITDQVKEYVKKKNLSSEQVKIFTEGLKEMGFVKFDLDL